MWVSTNFGFFSATERTDTVPSGDNRTLQIRARRTAHLDALRGIMKDQLGPTIEIANRDYQARAFTTPEAWGRALAEMSMMIDYDNFKNSVKDQTLHDAYMSVWSAMADAYGTGYSFESASWTNYRETGVSKYGSRPANRYNTPVTGKRGSRRGFKATPEYTPAPGTGWATGADAYNPNDLGMGEYTPRSVREIEAGWKWDSDDTITPEEIDEILGERNERDIDASDDPTCFSLRRAAKVIGVGTRELRDFMTSKPEWDTFRDGDSWYIPAEEISQLEFVFQSQDNTPIPLG